MEEDPERILLNDAEKNCNKYDGGYDDVVKLNSNDESMDNANSCSSHNKIENGGTDSYPHENGNEYEPFIVPAKMDSPPPPIQTIETNNNNSDEIKSSRNLSEIMSPLEVGGIDIGVQTQYQLQPHTLTYHSIPTTSFMLRHNLIKNNNINDNDNSSNIISNLQFGDENLNSAFIFIKPNANTPKVIQFIRSILLDQINPFDEDENDFYYNGQRIGIISEYDIHADIISKHNLIDKHYKDISLYAMGIKGSKSSSDIISGDCQKREKFSKIFGESLERVIAEKRIYNAVEAMSFCACTPDMLYGLWREAEHFGQQEQQSSSSTSNIRKVTKFDEGYYVANLLINDKNVYVINGFYMSLRDTYITPHPMKGLSSTFSSSSSPTINSGIHAFVIKWNASLLKWSDFREKVIGDDNPALAERGSIRQLIHEKCEELDLGGCYKNNHDNEYNDEDNDGSCSISGCSISSRSDLWNNIIHASSSPLTALAEQCNWLQHDINHVEFGRLLLSRGIPESTISDWCHNFNVKIPARQFKSTTTTAIKRNYDDDHDDEHHAIFVSPFDLVRDLDTKDCLDKLVGLYDYELFGFTQHEKCCKWKCW